MALCAVAQETSWEKYNGAGTEAYAQGRYAEAEKHWKAALKKAEKFGPNDSRLATSLNNLGMLYGAQSDYAKAEPTALPSEMGKSSSTSMAGLR